MVLLCSGDLIGKVDVLVNFQFSLRKLFISKSCFGEGKKGCGQKLLSDFKRMRIEVAKSWEKLDVA